MSLNFEIVEPGKGASELAYKTRAALSQFFADAAVLLEVPAVAELSKEAIRSLKDEGANAFKSRITQYGEPSPDYHPLRNTVLAYTNAFNNIINHDDYRQVSYKFEGLIRAVGQHLHAAGLKLDNEAQVLLMSVLNKDHCSQDWDNLRMERLGMERYEGPNTWSFFWACMNQFELHDVWVQRTQLNQYNPIRDPLSTKGLREQFSEWFTAPMPGRWGGDPYPRGIIAGPWTSPVLYIDVDGPWVAGLLTPQDTIRMRFTRVRLGSWLATLGVGDDDVREIVERVKSESAGGGTFKVYPNDHLFGGVYEAMAREGKGVSSCMAAPAEEYSTWDDIHPTDVYSSAHFGRGDNNLALFTYKVGEHRVGRGIVNTESMRCVRWYGSVHGERALKRIGVKIDGCALKGSWLALEQNGRRMIAPYLDGDIEYVKADTSVGRLYITNDGGMCASETSGVLGMNEVYCVDDDEYHDEDDCTYQSESNTWISEYCDDWRCPVIGEWCHEDERVEIMLDGEMVYVCNRVGEQRISQYLNVIDSPEGNPDETNYTGRGRWATVQVNTPYTPPPVQRFSWDELPVAQAAAPSPVLAADFATLEARIEEALRYAATMAIQSDTRTGRLAQEWPVVPGCQCDLCRSFGAGV